MLQWTHYKGALKEARKNRDSALADADKARADADKLRAALQARPRAPSFVAAHHCGVAGGVSHECDGPRFTT